MFISQTEYLYNVILHLPSHLTEETILNKAGFYKTFFIPKTDGMRTIDAVGRGTTLYRLQENLLKNLLGNIPLPLCAKGFVKGESYNSYLSEHLKKQYYLRIDLKDFFGSITEEQIKDNLKEFVKTDEALRVIGEICTLRNKVPQGAVTSPAISNLVFRRIDQRVTKYCQALGVHYTRYADDMLFSSDILNFKEKTYFLSRIKNITEENGFYINPKKTRYAVQQIVFAGYVVGENLHLSRKKMSDINTITELFRDKNSKLMNKYWVDKNLIDMKNWLELVNAMKLHGHWGMPRIFESKGGFLDYLCGYRAFIISILKENSDNGIDLKKDNSMRILSGKIKRLEHIIGTIENSRNTLIQ